MPIGGQSSSQTSNMHENNDTRQDEQRQQEQQSPRAADGEGQMHFTQTLHAGTEALQQRTVEIIAQVCPGDT
jgi:hypothetical protein